MHKKVILALVTFALGIGAYVVLSSGDGGGPVERDDRVTEAVNKFVSLPTSQSGSTMSGEGIVFGSGDQTRVRVYDDVSHRLKYQFEAEVWEPISETEFHLQKLMIQSYMPGGEITYITADDAQVTLARKTHNRLEPKRGWLKGNVRVTIDRTTTEWREEHPDLADRFSHPDDLVEIYLGEATFDLDQAELVAPGDIIVDGSEVRIENVRGLTLQWNQVDNRIDVLRFAEGGKMTLLRGGDKVGFVMPGGELASGEGREGVPRAGAGDGSVPKAKAMEPITIETVTAEEAAAQIRMEGGVVTANRPMSLEPVAPGPGDAGQDPSQPGGGTLRSSQELAEAMDSMQRETKDGTSGAIVSPGDTTDALVVAEGEKRKQRVHTYRAVFENDVVVQQWRENEMQGRLDAERLEVNFDFGKEQRALGAPRGKATPDQPIEGDQTPVEDEKSADVRLSLTWNGPLELRPMRVNPAEQTGKRFDVVATGSPVKVESLQKRSGAVDGSSRERKSTVTCQQLVYRNEHRQVWLAGDATSPVELSVDENSKLVGQQVFFDQERGLARVDGPGCLVSKTGGKSGASGSVAAFPTGSRAEKDESGILDRTKSMEIVWSRGVDLEFGRHTVQSEDIVTGTSKEEKKPYLQRAWFHGTVAVQQDDERLTADEVAVTFGISPGSTEMADHIQHLSTSGDVRLQRGDDVISADRIDTQMVVTPEGKNVPRIVDASGHVFAGQLNSQFKADKMHVVLGMAPEILELSPDGEGPRFGNERLGIETLDAEGSVFVSDPSHNLKISHAETLSTVMRNGNRLVRATITSPEDAAFARARYDDTAVHGHHIDIDVDSQSIDVPGPGRAWMVTRKDFGGRDMSRPTPVKITWVDHMAFRLSKNYGIFVGGVRTESRSGPDQSEPESFAMACDKLTVRFANVPPVKKSEDTPVADRFWLLGKIVGDKAETTLSEPVQLTTERKRPSYIVAEGNAEVLAQKYAERRDDGTLARLMNRMRISGDQVIADLAREQMSVPGKGSLLIEDYKFDIGHEKSRISGAAIKAGPLMSSVGDEGPSQTGVIWENSMDFFVDRNLVAFDKDVKMAHRSGMQLAKLDELAATMDVDPNQLQHIGSGRKADLACGHLLLEFLIAGTGHADASSPVATARVTDLKRLIARHAVHLQDGTKSLMGEYLQYLNDTNEVRLEGSPSLEARIIDQDEQTQRLNMWRGPLLIWDRETNRIEAPKARIRSSR